MGNLVNIPEKFQVEITFEQKSLWSLAGVVIVILLVAFMLQKIMKGV